MPTGCSMRSLPDPGWRLLLCWQCMRSMRNSWGCFCHWRGLHANTPARLRMQTSWWRRPMRRDVRRIIPNRTRWNSLPIIGWRRWRRRRRWWRCRIWRRPHCCCRTYCSDRSPHLRLLIPRACWHPLSFEDEKVLLTPPLWLQRCELVTFARAASKFFTKKSASFFHNVFQKRLIYSHLMFSSAPITLIIF